jgi:hypothetical protein
MTTTTEFNFEVYTKNPKTGQCGWDIKFVSVIADTKEEAKQYLNQWNIYDKVISFNFGIEIPFDGKLATLSGVNNTFKRKAVKGALIEMDGYRSGKYLDVLYWPK